MHIAYLRYFVIFRFHSSFFWGGGERLPVKRIVLVVLSYGGKKVPNKQYALEHYSMLNIVMRLSYAEAASCYKINMSQAILIRVCSLPEFIYNISTARNVSAVVRRLHRDKNRALGTKEIAR